jgi:hypothetical protein
MVTYACSYVFVKIVDALNVREEGEDREKVILDHIDPTGMKEDARKARGKYLNTLERLIVCTDK